MMKRENLHWLEKMIELCPPPENAINTGDSMLWVRLRDKCDYPADFQRLIETYGSGVFCEFLYTLSPFNKNPHGNFFERGKNISEAFKTSAPLMTKDLRLPVYPDMNGILPFGITENGDELFWITRKDNKAWKILILAARSLSNFEVYDCSIPQLLVELWNGGIKSKILTARNILPPEFQSCD